MLSCVLLSLCLLFLTGLVVARPSQYDRQFPALSNEEKHRAFLTDVVRQQFLRTVETSGSDAGDNVFTQRLYDMMFHLHYWRTIPECRERRENPLLANVTRVLFTAYYNGSKSEAVQTLAILMRLADK